MTSFTFCYYIKLKLCQAAEDKLFSIIPEKERRRIMRLKHRTTPEQVNEAENDLNSWQTEVIRVDKELRATETSAHTRKNKLPPVRGQKVEKLGIPDHPKEEASDVKHPSSTSKASERLSGYDFHAWEKFNVEEALATLDEEELELEKKAQSSRMMKKKMAEEAARKRMEKHNAALEAIRSEMNISNLSSVQRKTRAGKQVERAHHPAESNAF